MGINSGSVLRVVSIGGCWNSIDPGLEEGGGWTILGGV